MTGSPSHRQRPTCGGVGAEGSFKDGIWVCGPLPFLVPAGQVKSFPFPSPDSSLSHSAPKATSWARGRRASPLRLPAGLCLKFHHSFHYENTNSQGGDPLKDSFRSFSKSRIFWGLEAKLVEPQSSFQENSFLPEVLPLRNSRA